MIKSWHITKMLEYKLIYLFGLIKPIFSILARMFLILTGLNESNYSI